MVVIGGAGGPLPASRLSGHRSRRHATTTVAVVASKASAEMWGRALGYRARPFSDRHLPRMPGRKSEKSEL